MSPACGLVSPLAIAKNSTTLTVPDRPLENPDGRFHIDASGYRTWGFDYSSRTNPCPKLG